MGKKIRVQLHGFQNRGVKIDAAATDGAIVGHNLYWPDGTLVTAAQFEDAMQAGTAYDEGTISGGGGETASSVQLTLWSLILNIPAIIKSIVDLVGNGWMRKDGNSAYVSEHLWTKNQVDTGESVVVPTERQMLVWDDFILDGGDVTVDGELVVLGEAEDNALAKLTLESSSTGGIDIGDKAVSDYGWRDILGQIRQRGIGANDPSWSVISSTIFSAWKFAVNDEVWIEYHIPHDYVPGTDIHFHAHWMSDGADTTNTVKWEWSFIYADGFGNQAFAPGSPTTVTAEEASAGQHYHQVTETAAVTVSGMEVDGMLYVRLRRITNGATDSTNGIFLLTSDVHYRSNNMATKNKAPDFYT